MFVDTHCHLTMMRQEGLDKILQEASAEGVEKIITIGTTLDDSLASVEIARSYKNVFATVGIHPCDCSEGWRKDFREFENLVKKDTNKDIVGIGETGLDFYHKPFFKDRQIDAFVAHIEFAIEHNLPLILHIRDSAEEALKVLEKYRGEVRGIAHCFSQSQDVADILIAWGFCLGIGGPITYPKNNRLRDVVKQVSLENLLIETDAPFLPPQLFRGKRNYPKYIPIIAQAIADIKGIDVGVVESRTYQNFLSVLEMPKSKTK
jgi:TatD DNase family protein